MYIYKPSEAGRGRQRAGAERGASPSATAGQGEEGLRQTEIKWVRESGSERLRVRQASESDLVRIRGYSESRSGRIRSSQSGRGCDNGAAGTPFPM